MVETVVCTRLGPGLNSLGLMSEELPRECKIPRDEKSDETFCCALQPPMVIFLSKQLHTCATCYFITTAGNYRPALTQSSVL